MMLKSLGSVVFAVAPLILKPLKVESRITLALALAIVCFGCGPEPGGIASILRFGTFHRVPEDVDSARWTVTVEPGGSGRYSTIDCDGVLFEDAFRWWETEEGDVAWEADDGIIFFGNANTVTYHGTLERNECGGVRVRAEHAEQPSSGPEEPFLIDYAPGHVCEETVPTGFDEWVCEPLWCKVPGPCG